GSGGWSSPRPGTDEEKDLPPVQLYDLENDIGETRNLSEQYPDVVVKLTNLLSDYIRNGRSTPGIPQKNDSPANWPQLNWMKNKN
ncbi:arylsulfatase, partial [candidate division KSB1 bacterium]|nr:arylsulfatase [candidate division KSB1 bacterium]